MSIIDANHPDWANIAKRDMEQVAALRAGLLGHIVYRGEFEDILADTERRFAVHDKPVELPRQYSPVQLIGHELTAHCVEAPIAV